MDARSKSTSVVAGTKSNTDARPKSVSVPAGTSSALDDWREWASVTAATSSIVDGPTRSATGSGTRRAQRTLSATTAAPTRSKSQRRTTDNSTPSLSRQPRTLPACSIASSDSVQRPVVRSCFIFLFCAAIEVLFADVSLTIDTSPAPRTTPATPLAPPLTSSSTSTANQRKNPTRSTWKA